MLNVPEDFKREFPDQSYALPEATIIRYHARQQVLSTPVLVTRPTFVLVSRGVKQIKPQDEQSFLIVPTNSVLFMRSGAHLMSEFHGQDGEYASTIFSIDRTFLRQAVGVAKQDADRAKVVTSTPSEHAFHLFKTLPEVVAQPLPDIERQFKLRELLIALMGDPPLRQVVLDETADWGNSESERIVSIVTSHYLSPLQVADFAKLCAMSLSSFKRHFQKIYNIPPATWLTKQRLDYARSLIVRSNLSITEIGEASGYRDASSFVRAFRRHFGHTPTSLRLSN